MNGRRCTHRSATGAVLVGDPDSDYGCHLMFKISQRKAIQRVFITDTKSTIDMTNRTRNTRLCPKMHRSASSLCMCISAALAPNSCTEPIKLTPPTLPCPFTAFYRSTPLILHPLRRLSIAHFERKSRCCWFHDRCSSRTVQLPGLVLFHTCVWFFVKAVCMQCDT